MGQPKKKQSPVLRFRVDAEQKAHVEAAAKDAGYKTPSDYLRAVCLERVVVSLAGNDVVVIPPASSASASDERVLALIRDAVSKVQSQLAGEGSPEQTSPDPAPTSPSDGGQGEEPPQEHPGVGEEPAGSADVTAGSLPGSGETAPADSTAPTAAPMSTAAPVEGPPAATGAAGTASADIPAAPTYERFPPGTPIPPGTPEVALPPSEEFGEPGDFWLARHFETGRLFVAVVGHPIPPPAAPAAPAQPPAPQPPPVPTPPPGTGGHPLDEIGGLPPAPSAPPAEPAPAPREDPGPLNERGEGFTAFVERRAAELAAEGRPPIVAQQEAAAEWRQQGIE